MLLIFWSPPKVQVSLQPLTAVDPVLVRMTCPWNPPGQLLTSEYLAEHVPPPPPPPLELMVHVKVAEPDAPVVWGLGWPGWAVVDPMGAWVAHRGPLGGGWGGLGGPWRSAEAQEAQRYERSGVTRARWTPSGVVHLRGYEGWEDSRSFCCAGT